jgi:hypothetical protein
MHYKYIFVEIDLRRNYLLTPWSRVPLEKLTGFAASQEIPRLFGTQKFFTAFTRRNTGVK